MAEPRTVQKQTVGRGAVIPIALALLGFLMIWSFIYFTTVDVMPPLLAVTLGGVGLALLIASTAWWFWRIANARVAPARQRPGGGL